MVDVKSFPSHYDLFYPNPSLPMPKGHPIQTYGQVRYGQNNLWPKTLVATNDCALRRVNFNNNIAFAVRARKA